MKYYQQGDVIIEEIDYDIKGKPLNHLVLAEGEATGHAHRLNGLGKLIMMDNIMHLNIFGETALLKHEEHGDIELPAGKYRIRKVLEYDHFSEETKEVVD